MFLPQRHDQRQAPSFNQCEILLCLLLYSRPDPAEIHTSNHFDCGIPPIFSRPSVYSVYVCIRYDSSTSTHAFSNAHFPLLKAHDGYGSIEREGLVSSTSLNLYKVHTRSSRRRPNTPLSCLALPCLALPKGRIIETRRGVVFLSFFL